MIENAEMAGRVSSSPPPVDSVAAVLEAPDGGVIRSWSLFNPVRRWVSVGILFAVSTSSYFDYYVLAVVLDPIKQEFHISDTVLGLLGGFSFAVLYSASAMPIARWADRGNRRTIITLALIGWSVMTAAGGLVHSFWQLVLTRVGVGVVQPGATPPAQSLVADYFPPERRGTATAFLNAGSAAGYLVGIGLGGYIAASLGWRMAFLVAGLSGLLLAVFVRWLLPEPRCQLGFPAGGPSTEALTQAFTFLRRKRTFVFSVTGLSVYTIFGFSSSTFLPSFMIRDLHASLLQISETWAFTISTANLFGAVVGGRLADTLSKKDMRWYAWLPALSCALGAPLYWLTLRADSLTAFIVTDFFAELVLAVGISVSFVAVHAVCGSRRRTQAIAILQLSLMLVGAGCGPLVAGALSDLFTMIFGSEGLRYSLYVMVLFLIPASIAFYSSGCAMLHELED